jgi:outer membrane receptor protein involved in Fe transport
MNWIKMLSLFLTICVIPCIYSNFITADDQPYILEEVTVTGTRTERDTFEIPNAVSTVTSTELGKQSLGTAADMLCGATGVMVQKTTAGQGSPYVRGLTGYQTLIIVDGVRLTNSTFRSGPNQYLATIDPGQIEKIEVMRGYGSTLYGSSAIGGVINVFTKPTIESLKGFSLHPYMSTKFSSSDTGKFGRLGMDGGYKNFSFIAGGSYKDVGDLKPGKGYDIQLPTKKFLLTSQSNPSNLPEGAWLVDTEKPTGWKEKDGDVKLNYRIADGQDVKLAYQGVRQENVPRYDKYATKEYEVLLYNPQNRDLTYLNYTAREAIPFINFLQASVSYQKQEEGQIQQKAKSTSQTEINDATDIMGLSLQLDSLLGKKQKITYGGEFYHDQLNSQSITTDSETNKVTKEAWGAYPDGAMFWDMNAYVQDEVKILNNLEAVLSGRYTSFQTQADLSIKDPSFGEFKNSGDAVTGSFGLVYGVIKGLNLTFTAGQAFRAPSLSDTTAVKITNQAISAPNPDLKSERSSGIDVGIKTRSKYFSGSINYYFNRIKDSVTSITVQEAYAGKEMPKLYQDLISANKDAKITIAYNSKEPADIQGVEIAVNKAVFPLFPAISTYGNLTITRVKDIAENQPMLREMPINGIFGIKWDENKGKFWAETYSRFAVKQDRLAKTDRSDPRIPGTTNDPAKEDPMAYTPGWFTLNIRIGVNMNDYTKFSIGVENIANRRYREHGSGVDGPGRNFFAGIDYRF